MRLLFKVVRVFGCEQTDGARLSGIVWSLFDRVDTVGVSLRPGTVVEAPGAVPKQLERIAGRVLDIGSRIGAGVMAAPAKKVTP